jgi:hypothetical protein
LCEEYASTGKEIDALAMLKGTDVTVQADTLRKRRMAVEEEILTAIEGYQPA